MQIYIREALPSDVPDIFFVRTSVIENTMTSAELAEKGITEASVSAMIMASRCAWVAIANQTIVGFSMIDREDACLFAVFVLPGYEGNGIGKKLVVAAENMLFTDNPVIWLETGAKTRAVEFYRRQGWGNEKDIGGGDIRMEKHR